jgi:arsenate reductase (glutaredoxin)
VPYFTLYDLLNAVKKLRIYEYSKCSTCRKALKFLDNNKVPYEKVPIVETPPTKAELKKMLTLQGGNLKKLFNTSGEVYRAMKIGEKLSSLSESEAIELLASNGKLIKRPFALAEDKGLVGFNEDEWKRLT